MKPRVLAIIPARKGSQRVPEKNFRPFAETTLTDIAIKQCRKSKLIDKIVVSTDAEDIHIITAQYQNVTSISRPEALSQNESLAIDYMKHTIDYLGKNQEYYDLIVIIQPSNPLRKSEDIDQTIQLLLDNPDADSSVSIVKVSHVIHPFKLKTIDDKGLLKPWLVDEKGLTAAHQIPDIFVRNGAVYVFRTNLIIIDIVYGEKCVGYLMNSETSVDINDWIDFEFAEFLFKKNVNYL